MVHRRNFLVVGVNLTSIVIVISTAVALSAMQAPTHMVSGRSFSGTAIHLSGVERLISGPANTLLISKGGSLSAIDASSKAVARESVLAAGRHLLAADAAGRLYFKNATTVEIVDPVGRTSTLSPQLTPEAVAISPSGNIFVAAGAGPMLLGKYGPTGHFLGTFGSQKQLDPDAGENRFLNRGAVAVGPDGSVFYVFKYALDPSVLRFSEDGELLNEFFVTGAAVSQQLVAARKFQASRATTGVRGGIGIVNAATVDQTTGHLWLGLSGSSDSGVLYEYSPTGQKLAEYALDANNVITSVDDVVVKASRAYVRSGGELFVFDLTAPCTPTTQRPRCLRHIR